MRSVITAMARAHQTPDHFGLAYDIWAPALAFQGQEALRFRDNWLNGLENVEVCEDYGQAFECWKASFSPADSLLWTATLSSRLLVGHGNPSPTEIGLTVHHTWGTPIIPGSALKGVLANYLQTGYGPEREHEAAPRDPNHPEPDRARYQGAVWKDGRVQHGPGEVFLNLFGAPASKSDDTFGTSERQGSIVFHDALLVPLPREGRKVFARDILTVHQKGYYAGSGLPNDYEEPTPVAFMTVKPGVQFLFALSGPDGWVDLAGKLLREALSEWGVGGKTAANYGHLAADAASISRWQDERSKLATANQNAALASASPEERWGRLVGERKDSTLLDWARRVFEKGEDPLTLVPEDRRPAEGDSVAEKRALRDALEAAGYLREWYARKTLHEATNLGPDRLRARATVVRNFN